MIAVSSAVIDAIAADCVETPIAPVPLVEILSDPVVRASILIVMLSTPEAAFAPMCYIDELDPDAPNAFEPLPIRV